MAVNRFMQTALLKALQYSIRRGDVEGVRKAIEKGVDLSYVDSSHRNLLMMAMKYDTTKRLQICCILADANCKINHVDYKGFNCLHYACANGASDVFEELVRRGANVAWNQLGYGPEDLCIPKIAKANSLLQHTEQLEHESSVKQCWRKFYQAARKEGYEITCPKESTIGKPLKIQFTAPSDHSLDDRIRVVNLNSSEPLWKQDSVVFNVLPGNVGTITLDADSIRNPSMYRVIYEKYDVVEASKLKNQITSVDEISSEDVDLEGSPIDVIKKTQSFAAQSTTAKVTENTLEEDKPKRANSMSQCLRRESVVSAESSGTNSPSPRTLQRWKDSSFTHIVVAMSENITVSPAMMDDSNQYDVHITQPGMIGLCLECKYDKIRKLNRIIVRSSTGQATSVYPGDYLIRVGESHVDFGGMQYALYQLKESSRPLVLKFEKGNRVQKTGILNSIRRGYALKRYSNYVEV